MNQEIMNKVKNQYDNLIDEYGENRLLWVAAIGPGIYKLEEGTPIKIAACYLPTEEELYTEIPQLNPYILEIRYLLENIEKKDSTTIDMILSPYKIINSKYDEILKNNLFINKELLFLSNNENIINQLKRSIKDIILSSFDLKSQEQELIKILTKTELLILKNIIKDFDGADEGNIKVSQATEKYNASTAVFRTLFYKLKDYRVAEIDSRGVKGTHIKFNNLSTLKSLID